MKSLGVFISILLFVESWAGVAQFDNYKVYRLTPNSDEQVLQLRKLEDGNLDFDFWKSPTFKNETVDIMVAPHMQARFQDIINNLQIDAAETVDNVQRLIDDCSGDSESVHNHEKYDWTDYYRLDNIYRWLEKMSHRYPHIVKNIVGGRSYEGREIRGVKLSFKKGNKAVFIEGGIHAREWIAPATVTFIINEFLTNKDPAVREVAESYDWYIFPSVNPDGYAYTFTGDRLWRMTRTPHGVCYGVDANRNWDFHWNDGGTSDDPCNEKYLGPHPFSEPEMKSLSEYITSVSDKLVAYIAVHSYSQMFLIPYAYSNAHVENYNELMEIGLKAAQSLENRHGTKFRVGNWEETLYVASGVSVDWVKGNFHTPITYTIELRDTGEHGFLLPKEQIIPTGEETLDGLVTLMLEAKARGHK